MKSFKDCFLSISRHPACNYHRSSIFRNVYQKSLQDYSPFESVRRSKTKDGCVARVAQRSWMQNSGVLAKCSLHDLCTQRGSVSSVSAKMPPQHRLHELLNGWLRWERLARLFADLEVQRHACKQIQWWCSLPLCLIMPDSTPSFSVNTGS